ncbi:RNA polymerase sigma factor SigF [Streptomyces sp. H39-S7]|uniref:RNA polymerase sigma factor SigF n=1 Tax=Streptomyces sp. H39-S7 TaxID=3004357 RepID=UPI0022B019A2|nr:RNA polymerase sigma factor SigF [Streptomyces sp. H39-S7]MCZ4125265.1 RNA polymerase sigma factor SigF [Streptomyces sp. H39-S7]
MGAAAKAQAVSRIAVAPGTVRETVTEAELPWVEDAGKVAPNDARALSKIFFDQLQTLDEGTPEHQYARNTLIELNMALVKFAARRFRNRSEPFEDIVQVGTIGLIKAIDRFDLSREVEFPTFAVPYIVGEIKRFFRDTSWAVHVPRRLQEMRLALAKAIDDLSARLDRSPTTAELAAHLDLTAEEVVDGLMASNGYTAGSLDMPASEDDERGGGLADRLGDLDPAMAGVENLQTLKPLLAQLNDRDRRILQMRFGEELTQAQIGEVLGVSQMHVSRLLSSVLARLRRGMLAGTC